MKSFFWLSLSDIKITLLSNKICFFRVAPTELAVIYKAYSYIQFAPTEQKLTLNCRQDTNISENEYFIDDIRIAGMN